MSARDMIENLIWDGTYSSRDEVCGIEGTVDAILAAMPEILAGMVKELVWANNTATVIEGEYTVCVDSNKWRWNKHTFDTGIYGRNEWSDLAFTTEESAKAAANEHHRAQFMAALKTEEAP